MNTLFRNFSHTFRRFFTASLLNLIGLSIAFASFFVIMTQVDYDLNFNKGYKNYEKIFRVEACCNPEWGWQVSLPRPLCELISTHSPHVKAMTLTNFQGSYNYEVNGNLFHEIECFGFGDFLKTFQPEMLSGSTEALNQPNTVLIPESMAKRFFGDKDAIRQTIFRGKQADNQAWIIGGVYKDFPENSQFGNWLMLPQNPNENRDDWSNWNYTCYLRLDSPDSAPQVEKLILEIFMEQYPYQAEFSEEDLDDFIRLTPLVDTHFSTVGNKSAQGRTTVYLLICISFLIVLVATINFMNFSLAETPMRLKGINTRKVLGATSSSIRFSLLAESVWISLIAFAFAVILLFTLKDSGLKELVAGNLAFSKHRLLLAATFGISVLMGVLAGLYPSYYCTSFPPAMVLKGSFGLSPKGRTLRTTLVCFQFCVTYTLIIGVGIMYLQSYFIRTSDYGYDKSAIITGMMTPEAKKQTESVVNELSQIPGIEGISFSQFILSSGDSYMNWGRGEGDKYLQFDVLPVDYRFLDVMGIRVIEGRNFKQTDGDVYIFNEAARKKYPWLEIDRPATTNDYPIIGFCENIKYTSFRNDDNTQPMAFFIYGEDYKNWKEGSHNVINIRVAAGTDKIKILHTLQQTMEQFTPGHDFNFRFMDEVLDATYQNELRFTKQILLFSLLAILISMIGVFGLTMFESEYRRKEIGVRKIMGSSTKEILYMFNKRYLQILTGCFLVAAPIGGYLGNEWLQGFAEKTPISPWVFIISFLLVVCITILTVTFQSWKNANENPARSIKTE